MYLVLEYMKRGDLVNVLKKRTEDEKKFHEAQGIPFTFNSENSQFSPLSDFDLWHLFRQIISGIRYLHLQNIVHGDIKPQVIRLVLCVSCFSFKTTFRFSLFFLLEFIT
jgi:serine/threonine protein kinase